MKKLRTNLKCFDAYYSRFFLLAALLPLYIIYIIVTNPLGYDSTSPLSPIEQYPNAFIYYLEKCLLVSPFVIFGIFIVLFALRKRIFIRESAIKARGIFGTKHFNIKDITMVKEYESSRGSINAKVYVGSKCIFRMQDSLINYGLVIKRFRSEHIEIKRN